MLRNFLMMIDKQLIKLVPISKKYIALSVFLKWISLISNAVLIFSVAKIIQNKGQNILFPAILIFISIITTFLVSQFFFQLQVLNLLDNLRGKGN